MSGTETADHDEPGSAGAYERYCRQIDKEDELIHERVNWLLTSESILFAAVGLSGNSMAGVIRSVVPWTGLILSLTIGVTVWAASLSLSQYRHKLKEVCPSGTDLDRCYPQLHRKKWIILLGLVPSSIVPLIFGTAWIAVILME
jgi:hypothetical protein